MNVYKVLLVGYGNMGRDWGKVLAQKENLEVVGVVDVLKENRLQAQTAFSMDRDQTSAELGHLLDVVQPDFVIDCSTPSAHYFNALTTLQAGCHLLGEKPIALQLKDAEHVVGLARKHHRVYMVNQNYRWRPIAIALKNYLAKAPLGKIHTVNVLHAQNFTFKDTFRYRTSHTFLMDMAVHHFDLVRYLTASEFQNVYCIESCPKDSKFKDGAAASALFQMDNGSIFTYQGSWSDPGSATTFMGTWRIVCEKGTIVWDGSAEPRIETVKDGVPSADYVNLPEDLALKSENIFLHELEVSLDKFLNAIQDGSTPDTAGSDNIHTLDMVLSAIESSTKGKLVSNYLS